MQKLERLLARKRVVSGAPVRTKILGWITQSVLGQQHGSVGAPRNPTLIGKLLACYCNRVLFQVLSSCFSQAFSILGPAGKVPRITASGDDAGMGSKVPSTPADLSKGTEAIPPQKTAPAGSTKGGNAGTGGSKAMVVQPAPKLGMPKKFSLKRAPA